MGEGTRLQVGDIHSDRMLVHVRFGISEDNSSWVKTSKKFFLPVKALSKILLAMFRKALKKEAPELFAQIPKAAWYREWVLHCVNPSADGLAING